MSFQYVILIGIAVLKCLCYVRINSNSTAGSALLFVLDPIGSITQLDRYIHLHSDPYSVYLGRQVHTYVLLVALSDDIRTVFKQCSTSVQTPLRSRFRQKSAFKCCSKHESVWETVRVRLVCNVHYFNTPLFRRYIQAIHSESLNTYWALSTYWYV